MERLALDQVGDPGELCPGADMELPVNAREVAPHRAGAHEQGVRDLLVRASGCGKPSDPSFDLGELASSRTTPAHPGELGPGPVGPERRAELLEDREGVLERLPGGALLPGAATDPALDEQRPGELERHRKALVVLEGVIEGNECGREIAVGGLDQSAAS